MKYTVMRVVLAAVLGAVTSGFVPLSAAADRYSAESPRQIAQADALAEGEIRKVNKDAKKLTIKHGPIVNLDMPGMTMVFQVKDPAMLDQVKAGDKVRFAADKIGGAYVVTKIEAVK